MAAGPVDVAIIGFPGNKFSGKILPALLDLVDSGTIRVLDLLFVSKDADGVLTSLTISDLEAGEETGFAQIEVAAPGSLSSEDAEEVADDLEPNSSVALIAWENAWARRFVDALLDADAVLVDQIRIPADVVNAVLGD